MSNTNNDKNQSIFCPECRSVISLGEIHNEKKVSLTYVFCPHCGKRIDFEDYRIENKRILESTYKFVDIKKLDKTLQIIHGEKKFSQFFKKTLHHLLARIIYIEFRKLEDELELDISDMSLTPNTIKTIEKHVRGIYTQKPNIIYLRRLDKLSSEDFFSQLKKYQKKLRKNVQFRKSFSIYLRWVIEMVFRIMKQLDTEEGLLTPELVIKEDLIDAFGIDENRNDWGIEESYHVIDFCYRMYKDYNYNLREILDNKNDVIKVIFGALRLKFTDFIKDQILNIIRIIYHLLDFENDINTKRDLIRMSRSSKRIVYRVIKRIESEFDVDFSTRFHKRGLNNKRDEIMNKIYKQANENSIKILSTPKDYINSDSELNFECLTCGEKFSNSWRNIMTRKSGLKCDYCDPNLNPQVKEYYANRLKELIESKGGELLSEYANSQTKVHIRCEQDHEWWARPSDVNNGTWCSECYTKEFRMESKKEIKELIESKNGKLLDIDFSVKKTRVLVECENGHRWWTRRDGIIEGKWCKKCYDENTARATNNILKELIESKGGKLLSNKYNRSNSRVHVECGKGHKWWVTPDNLINGGTWCPKCHFINLSNIFTEYNISDLRSFAQGKGGDCLENEYLGWGIKHKWICSKKHVWTATPRNVIGRPSKKGTWCPFCADEEVLERVVRGILEVLLCKKFPKTSPDWLNEDKVRKPGGRRHLDGFNENLKIAFECHGIQHYKFEPFFHNGDINKFHLQQKRDEFVRNKCKEQRVLLLEIGYIKENKKLRRIRFSEIEDYLIKQLEKNAIKIPSEKRNVDWVKFISIHRKQDLILKLLTMKDLLSISQIASYLKFGLKSTRIHLKALKSLDLVHYKLGKQNKHLYSLNEKLRDIILDKTNHIKETEIKNRSQKILPTEQKIIELLQKNDYLTKKEISDYLQLSIRTITKYLKSLEIIGIIGFERRKGSTKSHPKLWYLN
ncbi:MAG: hypothetical protein BAJALOKI3v1_590005 [Promethearchaeota archaeon]|nr:MAG: hypothetical protein BAJALOKI3v1_590005 [Candidatus Lokiarchaeota archaeon]